MPNLSNEPAVILASGGAIVAAVLILLVSFGVPLTHDQQAAISAVAALVIPIVAGIAIRSQVTPVAALPATPPAPLFDTLPPH